MGNPIDAVFGNNKPPPPPDYAGAAQQTAAGDLEIAKYQTLANRPDEYGPEGSRTWSQHPDQQVPGATKWVARTTLNPDAQKTFDAQQRMDQGLAGLGEQGIEQMQGIFQTPFSIEGQAPTYQGATGPMPGYQGPGGRMPGFQGPEGDMPQYGEHRQNVMDSMMSRVNTDIGRDKAFKNSQLIAQGIPVGSDAYNREMEQLDRKQTDARQQAEISAEQMAGMGYQSALAGRGMESQEGMNNFLTAMQSRGMTADEAMAAYQSQMQGRTMANQEGMAGFTTGLDTRRQDIQEALLGRQTPINEMSAFRTGSQVNMPQFQPYGQQQFTGGPNYSQAATQQGAYDMAGYNAETAQQNTLASGMAGLGAAAIFASDRRLKKNLKRLGTSLMGLPVYAFDYIWGGDRQVGVMAQDVIKVIPEAVHTDEDGYMAVDYGMIS